MRSCLLFLSALIIMTGGVYAQTNSAEHHAQMALDCKSCHVCDRPTYEKPCLKVFPEFTRRRGITVYNNVEDAPEILKIDVLSNIYEPSIFTHRLHAEMAGMAGGCISCHHFNPPGRVAACRECHDPTAFGTDLSKPGLKGAYHRQCLNCHREWSHSNNCTVCHAEKGNPNAATVSSAKAIYQETRHPTVSEPTRLIYTTDEGKNPIVTFFHDDHARRYGLKCTDCHQNESCSRCHDIEKSVSGKKEPHGNCINCHADEVGNDCTFCHSAKEKPRFDHERTGFSLLRYHSSVDCENCHGKRGRDYTLKPDRNCNNCHSAWNINNFDHRVTGLVLDENHNENDCTDCHIKRNFAAAPSCTDCHDDISYPKEKPGKLIK